MKIDSLQLALVTSRFDGKLALTEVECHEGIGVIPTMNLLLTPLKKIYRASDFSALRGIYVIVLAGVSFKENGMTQTVNRPYAGYVERISVEVGNDGLVEQVRLQTRNWPKHIMSYQKSYRFFQDMTSVDIAREVFKGHTKNDNFHFKDDGVKPGEDADVSELYVKRPYVVQYGESDADFITRVLHDDRVLFSIQPYGNGKPNNAATYVGIEMSLYSAFGKLPAGDSLTYTHTVPSEEEQRTGVYNVKAEYRKAPDAIALAAFDTTQFNVDLRTKAGFNNELRQWVEVGVHAHYTERDAGVQMAQDVLAARGAIRYHLSSGSLDLQAGRRHTVTGMLDTDVNLAVLAGRQTFSLLGGTVWHVTGDFLCVEEEGAFVPVPSAGSVSAPSVPLTAKSASTALMEATMVDPPSLPGLLRGVVVAKADKGLNPKYASLGSDDVIDTDEMGRIRVRILWHSEVLADEAVPGDMPWLRLMTPWAGQDSGFFALPRAGQEVVVSFVNGDPSMPVVMGCVYGESKGVQNSSPPWSPAKDPSWVGLGTRAGGAGRQFFRIDGQYSGDNKGIEAYSAAKMHLEADGKQQLRAPIIDAETKSKGAKITMSDSDYTMYSSTVNTTSADEKRAKGNTLTTYIAELRAGVVTFEALAVKANAAAVRTRMEALSTKTYGLDATLGGLQLTGRISGFQMSGLEIQINGLTILI